MSGMSVVGDLFGSGRCSCRRWSSLPRVAKQAVALLLPYMEAERPRPVAADSLFGQDPDGDGQGDVHDIGKHRPGVVLSCNNYEIIDLGVMVPAHKILETAKAENVDVIGLSGLITPSLDEMVHVASEMEREGFDIPLMIGGATTSRVHTAVKIHPPVQWWSRPSMCSMRAARSASSPPSFARAALRLCRRRPRRIRKVAARHHQAEAEKQRLPLDKARANAFRTDWTTHAPPKPTFLGTRLRKNYDLGELAPLHRLDTLLPGLGDEGTLSGRARGQRPGAGRPPALGRAQAMLREVLQKNWFRPKAVIGFWPANADGDDIRVFTDDSRSDQIATFFTLRQQQARDQSPTSPSPISSRRPARPIIWADSSSPPDSRNISSPSASRRKATIVPVLEGAGRPFRQTFAERVRERVAREFWGYASDEHSADDLILEKYRGIRPARAISAARPHRKDNAVPPAQCQAAHRRVAHRKLTPCGRAPRWRASISVTPAPTISASPRSSDQVGDYARRKAMVSSRSRALARRSQLHPRSPSATPHEARPSTAPPSQSGDCRDPPRAHAAVDPKRGAAHARRPLHDHDAGSERVACAARGDNPWDCLTCCKAPAPTGANCRPSSSTPLPSMMPSW